MNFKQAFIAFWTILYAEGVRMLRLWKQTLLPPAITSILYFLATLQIAFTSAAAPYA